MNGFTATAKDGGVARLEAKCGGINRDVRPSLINDPDDTQRHSHPTNLNPTWLRAKIGDFTDRIGQRSHLGKAIHHRGDGLVV